MRTSLRALIILSVLLISAPGWAQDSVKSAIADQYRIYVDDLRMPSSPTFEDLYKIMVSWNPLQNQVAYVRAGRSGAPATSFQSRVGTVLSVKIESITVDRGQAVVIVSKRVGGGFSGDRIYQRGEANGTLKFKHVWRDTGDGWRLLTSIAHVGSFNTAASPYPARKRVFNPNQAFSKPDILFGEVTSH